MSRCFFITEQTICLLHLLAADSGICWEVFVRSDLLADLLCLETANCKGSSACSTILFLLHTSILNMAKGGKKRESFRLDQAPFGV